MFSLGGIATSGSFLFLQHAWIGWCALGKLQKRAPIIGMCNNYQSSSSTPSGEPYGIVGIQTCAFDVTYSPWEAT